MKDQLIMSKNNAEVVVAIPLYRQVHEESLGKMDGYSISLTNGKPAAYAIDAGPNGSSLVNAEWLEKHPELEWLGDL